MNKSTPTKETGMNYSIRTISRGRKIVAATQQTRDRYTAHNLFNEASSTGAHCQLVAFDGYRGKVLREVNAV